MTLPLGPLKMPKYAQWKNRDQRISPETIIGVGQHERVEPDFGHFPRPRSTDGVGIHFTDGRDLEVRITAFHFDTPVNKRTYY